MTPPRLSAELTTIVDSGQSVDEMKYRLNSMTGVHASDPSTFQIDGVTVRVGLDFTLESMHRTLRALEPLKLGIAPVVIFYRELEDGGAILVTRYLSAPEGRIIPVDSADGPFRNAAKADFRRDFDRLLEAGYRHPTAWIRGFDGWMFIEDSSAIVLDSWWFFQELGDPDDSHQKREFIDMKLDQLPWRRRVADKAEALRRALGHADPAAEAQVLLLLDQAGYPLEAELWGAHLRGEVVAVVTDGLWHGRTAHLGRDAPPDAKLGDLWFDPCELSVLLRVRSGWLALRPLEPWQCVRAPRIVPPDCVAGLAGEPIVDLTWQEALSIATMFGKTLPDCQDWVIAENELSNEVFESLWSGHRSEWTSTPSPARSDEVVVISRRNIPHDMDYHVAEDAGRKSPTERGMTARSDQRQPRLTMRTFLKVRE